ncbi:RNA-binding S4 domain-containing protein [Clostridium tarantellae]|uniref:RQC P-site tRNA stabilizing factor n=1 Tax=Clostridium tarantellae TaxID=39493 RepID=A0A6I1MJ23_9CLOT|nr:RNA-binding S4 domain-containing protein [Clostridium tarantellae]MPQ42167.1 RNA-binding S4 domain-containing protein [Clostridium tarantellae]
MRLDKYLKVSRIIKRRTIAKEACEGGRVIINNKVAKPSTDVKEGDVIEILFGNRSLKAEIINIADHVRKENAKDMYKILGGEEDKDE